MSESKEVEREPWSAVGDIEKVEESFQFNSAAEAGQEALVQAVEQWGKAFAIQLATFLPEGMPKQTAISNVLGAVLWAKQSLTHRGEVTITPVDTAVAQGGVEGAVGTCGCPSGEPSEPGTAGAGEDQCCERDHNHDGNCDQHPA